MNTHCDTIVELTFNELKRDNYYEGTLEVRGVQLDFQLTFEPSWQVSEKTAMVGHDPLKHVSLAYFKEQEKIDVPNIRHFDKAVYMGHSIFIHKREAGYDTTTPIKAPVVAEEEMHQFPTPIDLLSYVRELNGL